MAVSKVLFGKTFNTTYSYNIAGQVTSIKYPSNKIVRTGYDLTGRLCVVATTITDCNTFTRPYAKNYQYNANTQETAFTYGNGVAASFLYSPDRMLLTSVSYLKGTNILFNLGYWYKMDSQTVQREPPIVMAKSNA